MARKKMNLEKEMENILINKNSSEQEHYKKRSEISKFLNKKSINGIPRWDRLLSSNLLAFVAAGFVVYNGYSNGKPLLETGIWALGSYFLFGTLTYGLSSVSKGT